MYTLHQVPELAEAMFGCIIAAPAVTRVPSHFEWTLPAFQRLLQRALSSLLSGGPSAIGRIPGQRFLGPSEF
jgi:hypothetical protein